MEKKRLKLDDLYTTDQNIERKKAMLNDINRNDSLGIKLELICESGSLSLDVIDKDSKYYTTIISILNKKLLEELEELEKINNQKI